MELMEKVKQAPGSSGCYIFKDEAGQVIYVGKAKVLRNRVRQYFLKANQQDDKGLLLGKLIRDVEFVLTDTERDALLEEYRLIKHYRPWFNTQHKNDRITEYCLRLNHRGLYPTFEITAARSRSDKNYLATFRSEGRAAEAITIMNRVFQTPLCNKALDQPAAQPCLHYQVGHCLGPCSGKISPEQYQKVIRQIRQFFGGRYARIFARLKHEMNTSIKNLDFEKAALINRNIEDLQSLSRRFHTRTIIPLNRDVVLFYRAYREETCSAYYIRGGEVTTRADLTHSAGEAKLQRFLETARSRTSGDKGLRLRLQNVYADKLAVLLPARTTPEKTLKLLTVKLKQWQ